VKVYNWETNQLVRAFSRRLGISRRAISFAGTKDKRALTVQLFSFVAPPRAVLNSNLKDVYILDYYRSNERVDIGKLYGNRFEIVIRGIPHPRERIKRIVEDFLEEMERLGGFPNFFGVQRFGAIRPITHIVGKKIIEGRMEEAIFIYLTKVFAHEPQVDRRAREFLEESSDLKEALKLFPRHLTFERAMIQHLISNPGDYLGALKVLPENLFKLFTHAYQSYLFNRIVSARIKEGLPLVEAVVGDIVIPLKEGIPHRERRVEVTEQNLSTVNRRIKEGKAFVTALLPGSEPLFASGMMGEIERRVLEEEGVDLSLFNLPEFPRFRVRSLRRELHSIPMDLSFELPPEEEGTLRTSFHLFRGTYATSFLRELMKAPILNY